MSLSVSELKPISTKRVESRWRRIVTPIPVPESLETIKQLRAVEPRSMAGMPPIIWEEAEGFLVRDPFGNQWIDLTSGIVLANAGHSHPAILGAIRQATERKLLHSYAFPTEVRRRLLDKLVALSPIADAKALVFSSGTEATECAMSIIRRYGQSISKQKVGILSFEGSYHGRTLAARLAGGKPQPNDWIQRQQVHHYQIPFPFSPNCRWGHSGAELCDESCFEKCLDSLSQQGVSPDQIAGIIAEAMPGWATWPIPPKFAQAMNDWAREHNILVTLDEVQSGCGRTGRFFAFEHTGIRPDLIVLGKGLTSSLPVSAVLGPRKIMDLPLPGEMSSTHGGNPICAAAALANLEVIDKEQLVETSARTGAMVLDKLALLRRDFPERVLSVHGRGLFISVHLRRPEGGLPDIALADAIANEAVRKGVMMFTTGGGFFKFVPPLGIDPEAALEAADVIRECFDKLIDRN